MKNAPKNEAKTHKKHAFSRKIFGLNADKRLKNSQKPEKISKTKKMTPSEDRAAQKSESSCPPPKR